MNVVYVIPISTETMIGGARIQLEIRGRLLVTHRKGDNLVVAIPEEDTAGCSLFNLGQIDKVTPYGESGREFLVRTRESGGCELYLKLADGVQVATKVPSEVA